MGEVPLRDYVEGEIRHVKRLLMELRQADAQRDSMLRENIDARLDGIGDKVSAVDRRVATLEGWRSNWEGRVSAVMAALFVINLVLGGATIWLALQGV